MNPGAPPVCWYFAHGMCAKGNSCPFKHWLDQDGQVELVAMAAQTPSCWYYERGCCMKSVGCPFKHIGNIPQSAKNLKRSKIDDGPEPEDDSVYTAAKVALEPIRECE